MLWQQRIRFISLPFFFQEAALFDYLHSGCPLASFDFHSSSDSANGTTLWSVFHNGLGEDPDSPNPLSVSVPLDFPETVLLIDP